MAGKKLFATLIVSALLAVGSPALAQTRAGGRMEAPRDQAMETNAIHNLQVARWYLSKRKAYEGARDRLQEIVDGYPEFSKIVEVYFLLGEAHQKIGKPEKAAEFYDKVVKEFPGSEFAKKSQEQLDKIKKP